MTNPEHLAAALLRPWASTDVDDLLAAFSGSNMREQGADNVKTRAQAENWIVGNPWSPVGKATSLAVDVNGRAAGLVRLSGIDRRMDSAWLAYWIAEEYRGHGLARRAAATVAGWALTDGGLYRLELGHRVNNPQSGSVARRAGFVREGLQREKLRYDDKRYDVELYSRLATDPVPEVEVLAARL